MHHVPGVNYLMQKLIVLFLLFCLAPIALRAQLSALVYWQEPWLNGQNAETPASLRTIEVGYWMRLKSKRLEFYPSLILGINQVRGWKRVGAGLDGQVYPFDYKNDCKCPSFSKKYNFFKKGLFLLAGSGILGHLKAAENAKMSPYFRAGLGQDIGLNNFLTLTPLFTVQFQKGPVNVQQNLYVQGMIRLTFRWDKRNF